MVKKRLFHRLAVQLAGLAVMLLMGAHPGFSEEPLVLQPGSDGIQRATLKMESYAYTPNEFVVQPGKPVELSLENTSFLVPHNFLLDSPEGQRIADVSVSGGDTGTVQFTLTSPGIYPFYCDKQLLFFPTHQEEGMEGRIIVR